MEEKKQQNIGREMYEWVQALVCSVLAVVILFTFVVRLIGVDGHFKLSLAVLQDAISITRRDAHFDERVL